MHRCVTIAVSLIICGACNLVLLCDRNFISNFVNGGTEVEDKEFASVDEDANNTKEKVRRRGL